MEKDIEELINGLKAEQEAQDRAIQSAIRTELSKTQIGFENLDSNLKTMIMQKGGAPMPMPSGEMPKPAMPKTPEGQPKTEEGKTERSKIERILKTPLFYKVIDDLLLKNNVYLYGLAGTGKTVLATNVALALCSKEGMYKMGSGEPYYIINCSQWTSPMQIVGGWGIEGYQEGQLEKAWKNGGVLILDELPKLDPNTAGILNDALAKAADDDSYMVNGKGDKLKKHKDFMVIGTGNTDMKSVSVNFSGNNRQDYSLVDRFVGSMYKVDYEYALEFSLVFTSIIRIGGEPKTGSSEGTGTGVRGWLKATDIEAFSLRSMLNLNRVYANEMLRKLESPLTKWQYGVTEKDLEEGKIPAGGKTLKDSVDSFLQTLGVDRANNFRSTVKFRSILNPNSLVNLDTLLMEATMKSDKIFIEEYKAIFGYDPASGKQLTKSEIELAQIERAKRK